jgi:hypothetical protein
VLLLLLPEEEKDEKDFLKSITKISGPFSHQLDTIISGQQAKTGHINMTQIELRCCAAIINITQCKKKKKPCISDWWWQRRHNIFLLLRFMAERFVRNEGIKSSSAILHDTVITPKSAVFTFSTFTKKKPIIFFV